MTSKPQPRSLPAVGINPHHVRLPLRLYSAAQQAARVAIQHHASADEGEQLQAAIAIGSAAEYLARAAVAFQDPLLLAKEKSPDSQIMLSRANLGDPLNPSLLRSIDLSDVWKLLHKLNKRLAPHMDRGGNGSGLTALVMNVRNAAAHMALVDAAELEAAARALVTLVEAMHPVGNRDEASFWPVELATSVQLLKTGNSSAAARRSQAKIDLARENLRMLLAGMKPDEQERTQALLESRDIVFVTLERYRNVPTQCPACTRQGAITYLIEEGEPEHGGYEETPGGSYVDYGWSRSLTFTAATFECPVCALRLTPDEFEGSGLQVVLEEEWENVEDPYADWEPDEDELRGR
ncbi:hypothetical protein [Microbacterium arborescens]|uniref:hypothetical protein n=1 Tax=Microbacterium arborescens TaxID=33883 RepID=UPI000DF8094A|nr:hypothetical protein [Microbacterium arborescens]